MAHLSNTQKKSRNSFIAMLVGIILVSAAIAFVLFEGITAKSNYLKNQKLATAISEVLGKRPMFVSESDLQTVKYLEVSYNADSKEYNLAVGFDDFIEQYKKYVAQQDKAKAEAEKAETENKDEASDNAAENTDTVQTEDTAKADDTAKTDETAKTDDNTETEEQIDLSKYVKTAVFKGDEKSVFTDLAYFTGVEVISISSVPVADTSIFAGYKNLTRGYFYSNGITDVSAFGKLDLTKIEELDFTGNTITDWSPLESISDKVTVTNAYSIEQDENGQYQYVPTVKNLTQYLEEQAAEEAAKDETETTDGETVESATDTTVTAEDTQPQNDTTIYEPATDDGAESTDTSSANATDAQ